MKKTRILLVDDELSIIKFLRANLEAKGYEVTAVMDGAQALQTFEMELPDLVILDIMMPKVDGVEVCRRIREWSDVPIIILSARGDENDKVKCLELGADDYIVKPFSPRQLVARAQALLRRVGAPPAPTSPVPLNVGDLTLDVSRCEVGRRGQPTAHLTRLECRMLEILMLNSYQVLPADTLIYYVWGPEGSDRGMLKQLIYRLRRKIEPDPSDPSYLKTVPGIGYTLVPQPPTSPS